MKKITCFIISFIFLFLLFGCLNDSSIMSFDSNRYIRLYDYSSESIDYNYTQISDEDVESIILMELSVNESYVEVRNKKSPEINDIVLISIDGEEEYYTLGNEQYSEKFDEQLKSIKVGQEIRTTIIDDTVYRVKLIGIYRFAEINDTEFILDYYRLSTFTELETFIRNRAYNEIIFNDVFDKIVEQSAVIDYPEEIKRQIKSDIIIAKKQVLEKYKSFEAFLKENAMSEDDFNNQIANKYYELMLYKAILDNEGYEITKLDIERYKTDNSISNEYNYYDIYEQVAYEKVRDILISKVKIIK